MVRPSHRSQSNITKGILPPCSILGMRGSSSQQKHQFSSRYIGHQFELLRLISQAWDSNPDSFCNEKPTTLNVVKVRIETQVRRLRLEAIKFGCFNVAKILLRLLKMTQAAAENTQSVKLLNRRSAVQQYYVPYRVLSAKLYCGFTSNW